jgi:hypothetical protein
MEVEEMNRRYVYTLAVAVGVLTLIVVGLIFWWSADPIPHELVRRWRLVRLVVNGQGYPPAILDHIITIEQGSAEGWPYCGPLAQHPGCLEWSDGCNTHWARFSITRAGEMEFAEERIMTAELCLVQDKETGEWVKDTRRDLLLRPEDAVAYEIRDGELWLYTSRDKQNALVLK